MPRATLGLVGLLPHAFATPIFDVEPKRIRLRGSITGGFEDLAKAPALAVEGNVRPAISTTRREYVIGVLADLKPGKVNGCTVRMR
jgi:D-arabinose 1-dehydrogenase-like Zn-dependent alcohol dehydrogenase